MDDFRDRMTAMGDKALTIMDDFLNGTGGDATKIKYAAMMITGALKVEHMNQVRDHTRKSLALRLIKFLPNDPDIRDKYIALTNPETKPLLLSRPAAEAPPTCPLAQKQEEKAEPCK